MDQEMNQQTGTEALAVCPRKKKDKKPVVFYSDRMVFNDETILYRDIESVSSFRSDVCYNLIFNSLSTRIVFKLKDGRKLKWKNSSNCFFGLGSVKSKRAYYIAALTATVSTVVKAIAARYLITIKEGGTIQIGGVTVSPTEISGKRFAKKTTVPLSEIERANWSDQSVAILMKGSNKLALNQVASNIDNCMCLVYIINSLCGNDEEPVMSDAPVEDK
ncbi:MAG: hypothetical protein J5643_07480 [Lachnospiraceae bacterium]|nr:hypothetical protein [Lachnospiraceae bacterium]